MIGDGWWERGGYLDVGFTSGFSIGLEGWLGGGGGMFWALGLGGRGCKGGFEVGWGVLWVCCGCAVVEGIRELYRVGGLGGEGLEG